MWAVSFVLLALGVLFSFLTRAVPDPNAFGLPFDTLLSAARSVPDRGRARGLAATWERYRLAVLCRGRTVRPPSAAYGWGVYRCLPSLGTPRAELAAWLSTWLFVPALFCIPVYLFLLFPDGRLVSSAGVRRLAGRRGVAGDDRRQRSLARSPRRATIRVGRESRRARRCR